jgi:hypothetical protein
VVGSTAMNSLIPRCWGVQLPTSMSFPPPGDTGKARKASARALSTCNTAGVPTPEVDAKAESKDFFALPRSTQLGTESPNNETRSVA